MQGCAFSGLQKPATEIWSLDPLFSENHYFGDAWYKTEEHAKEQVVQSRRAVESLTHKSSVTLKKENNSGT